MSGCLNPAAPVTPSVPLHLRTNLGPANSPAVCRLGLATRGQNALRPDDTHHAVARGVNFLNWCAVPDALSRAVAGMGDRRRDVLVCVQFEARTAADADVELRQIRTELRTDYVDVLTFYYVEEPQEWQQIIGPGGALESCRRAQQAGAVGLLGLTTHQRPLAAEAARSGLLDLLMIRYNAAHRGAEQEVFPVTLERELPVVAYTALRWGALLWGTLGPAALLYTAFALGCVGAAVFYLFCRQAPVAAAGEAGQTSFPEKTTA